MGEEVGDVPRRAQEAFVVAAPLALAAIERSAVLDRDEHVLQRRQAGVVRMDVSGSDRSDSERLGELVQDAVPGGVPTFERPLELNEEAVAAKCAGQPRGSVRLPHREPVPRTAGQADEAVVQLLEL